MILLNSFGSLVSCSLLRTSRRQRARWKSKQKPLGRKPWKTSWPRRSIGSCSICKVVSKKVMEGRAKDDWDFSSVFLRDSWFIYLSNHKDLSFGWLGMAGSFCLPKKPASDGFTGWEMSWKSKRGGVWNGSMPWRWRSVRQGIGWINTCTLVHQLRALEAIWATQNPGFQSITIENQCFLVSEEALQCLWRAWVMQPCLSCCHAWQLKHWLPCRWYWKRRHKKELGKTFERTGCGMGASCFKSR